MSVSKLIDDEGNLLGIINIVDAFVIFIALAVVLAGAGFVLGGSDNTDSPSETVTTFVTLDLGTQPDYIVSALSEGDTYSPTEGETLTITDLSLTPQGEQTRVFARVELQGVLDNGEINYANGPFHLGRTLDIYTETYNVTGSIIAVGNQSTLDTESTTVLLQDTVSADEASKITPGDAVSIDGYTAATAEDVAVYPLTNPDRRRVLVEATLTSYIQQGTRSFGGTALRPGQQVTLPTDEYTITGRLEQVDSSLQSRELTNRTVRLELSRVRADTANALQAGQTEQAGTVPTAYVTDVETEPAQIISTAQDGSVVISDHPTLRDVTLTTELRVAETRDGIQFRGERIQLGSTVVLDLGIVNIETRVVAIGR